MIIQDEVIHLATAAGPMRTHLTRPVAPGRYPGVILFSEIFQRTAPIARTAALFAGHGFVVATPELFHEFEPAGTVLAYDQAGAAAGNRHKVSKTVAAFDDDTATTVRALQGHAACTGKIGALGICMGGHLSFRAAMLPEVRASACYYATDLHQASLGSGGDDSLARSASISGELMMVWGRQDPHVPPEGRAKIYAALSAAGVRFTWHEFNGAHAFVRDEGPRYDPELAQQTHRMAVELFRRRLGEGDQ